MQRITKSFELEDTFKIFGHSWPKAESIQPFKRAWGENELWRSSQGSRHKSTPLLISSVLQDLITSHIRWLCQTAEVVTKTKHKGPYTSMFSFSEIGD